MDTQQTPRTVRREPMAAFLLSFLCGGLGHIYCGRFGKGIGLYFIGMVTAPAAVFLLLPCPASLRVIGWTTTGVSLAVWVYAMADAPRIARRMPPDYVPRDYNRWYVYLLLALLYMPMGVSVAFHVREHVAKAYVIRGDSMSPTIRSGERILVDKLAYRDKPVRRGDIVVIRNPDRPRGVLVGRVAALPGDTVEITGGAVLVNGKRLAMPTASQPANSAAPAADMPPTKVLPGRCFVLGDNPRSTSKSRRHGPLPLRDIVGRAIYIYFPRWVNLSRGPAPGSGE